MPAEWVTTTILLERLMDLGDDVWNRFSDRFQQPIVEFACRSGLSRGDAEDVAQETLLAFVESYRQGQYQRSTSRLRSWLFGIAHHKVVDAVRREQRRTANQVSVGGRPSYFEGIHDETASRDLWELNWEEAVARSCMEQIRREIEEKTWRAFEMVTLEGLAPAAVAEQLDTSRNSVFIAKHRVLKRLRELRTQFEDEPT